MPIETIEYKGDSYPLFQSQGNAMQFAIPFFKQFIKEGEQVLDIGCNRKEWSYPNASLIDPEITTGYDAYNFPEYNWDAIVSSHCLEHLNDWVGALDYWATKLKQGGFLGLYLPDANAQTYWRPSSNRRHKHHLCPYILHTYFADRQDIWTKVFVSGTDLNCSFICIAEKL